MTVELGKEEKAQIINSHKRTLAYNKYNLEIDILQENAKSNPSATGIANIQAQISDINNQVSALDAELTVVEAS